MNVKDYFDKLNLPDWEYVSTLTGGGQSAEVLVVKKDGVQGVFKVLGEGEDLMRNETDKERFKREMEVLTDGEFRHRSIVQILEHSQDPEEYWYISKLGESFEEYWLDIKTSHRPDEVVEQALDVICELTDGLATLHAHAPPIIHRDIKAPNIILDPETKSPVLIDFGVLYRADKERLTSASDAVGNAECSPDPMLYWMDKVDPWVDVFQLIQVLIWMTSVLPNKSWKRPMGWQWVQYSDDLSQRNVMLLRAITALGSNHSYGPKNAAELKSLIEKLRAGKLEATDSKSTLLDEIGRAVAEGQAISSVKNVNDLEAFNSNIDWCRLLVLGLENDIKETVETLSSGGYECELDTSAEQTMLQLHEWVNSIGDTNNHSTVHPIKVNCGERGKRCFFLDFVVTFYRPSLRETKGIDLPEDALPLWFQFGVGASIDNFPQHQAKFVTRDSSGRLFIYDTGFRNRKEISFEEFKRILTTALLDPQSWKFIS